jgi:hypothetical protein
MLDTFHGGLKVELDLGESIMLQCAKKFTYFRVMLNGDVELDSAVIGRICRVKCPWKKFRENNWVSRVIDINIGLEGSRPRGRSMKT